MIPEDLAKLQLLYGKYQSYLNNIILTSTDNAEISAAQDLKKELWNAMADLN
jgi:hypothetical protein